MMMKQLEDLKAQNANLKAQSDDRQRMLNEQVLRGPGYRAVEQVAQERRAGILPPGYEGIRDLRTGELLSQFKLDPYQGRASQVLSEQAFSQGASPWAQMQMQKQALEESQGIDKVAQEQARATAQAQSQMMRLGGLSQGARNRMAMDQARQAARAQQAVRAQGMGQRLGIEEQDINRKQDLLGRFSASEMQAQAGNIGALTQDVGRSGLFDMERYKKQMEAFGAQQAADAQRAAARGGGKK